MKFSIRYFLILCLIAGTTVPTAWAEIVTEDEAWTVAENYVQLIINKRGDWGGAPDAQVASMERFTRDDRTLGYFFHVEPQGFILASLCKELTPVKAYSTHSTLDPASEGGLTDLLKTRLLRTIEYVEEKTSQPIDQVTPKDWSELVETDYQPAWNVLTDVDFDATQYRTENRSRSVGMNYQEGDKLLTSRWHQAPPYNDDCPDEGCSWPTLEYYNTNTWVGCVATAGVQILRYWSWPPCNSAGNYIDAYTWSNMPGVVSIYSPQDQIDCVAAASYSVANSVGMDFGCDGSSAPTSDMEQVFQNRRYHGNCNVKHRDDYSGSDWFNMVIAQFNLNRPVQYRVEEHSIVGDGWRIINVGGVSTKQYHFIYGWYDGHDTWYAIDDIHLGGYHTEYMVRTIFPENSLGDTLSGTYPTEWESINHFDKPTRYFNLDASGADADFEAGQAFQYVRPGLLVQHDGSVGGPITFRGGPGAIAEFYHGAPFGAVKIRISDGALKLRGGGQMVIH